MRAFLLFVASIHGAIAVAGGNSLLYLRNAGDRCEWNVLDLATRKTSVYLSTVKCPIAAVWDARGKTTYFEIDGKIHAHGWKSTAKPKIIADCGAASSAGPVDLRLWIDPATRKLRRGVLHAGDEVKQVEEGGETYYEFRGKRYPPSPLRIGMPALAVDSVVEGGKCTVVAEVPSETAACDTPGMAVIATGTAEKSLAYHSLYFAGGCGGQLECDAPAKQKEALRLKGVPIPKDGSVGWLPMKGAGNGFLFVSTAWDGKWRVGAPAYFCQENCAKRAQLEGLTEKSEVSGYLARDGYAAIQDGGLRVYEFPSPKPIFSVEPGKSKDAVPFSAFWDLAAYPLF